MLLTPKHTCLEGLSLLISPHNLDPNASPEAPHWASSCSNIKIVRYLNERNNKKALLSSCVPHFSQELLYGHPTAQAKNRTTILDFSF